MTQCGNGTVSLYLLARARLKPFAVDRSLACTFTSDRSKSALTTPDKQVWLIVGRQGPATRLQPFGK
jgi:hypothetical protein